MKPEKTGENAGHLIFGSYGTNRFLFFNVFYELFIFLKLEKYRGKKFVKIEVMTAKLPSIVMEAAR